MKKILKFLFPVIAFALPVVAIAQSDIKTGLGNLSGMFSGGSNWDIVKLITVIIQILLLVTGLIAVLFLIIGGFWYITSAGNEEQAEKGKNTVVNAIIGLVIIILSYIIVNVVVNTVLGGTFSLF